MAIPREHRGRFIYHFTSIDHLPGILERGFHSINEQIRLGITHNSIANKQIQGRRSTMEVTCGPGGFVHDYVPFYLCKRSSMMLGVLNVKNIDQYDLIYLAVPIGIAEEDHVVFTDAAANTEMPPDFFHNTDDLQKLNWAAIDKLTFRIDDDAERQARMAEVLIHRSVEVGVIDHIIVWNSNVAKKVEELYSAAGKASPPIRFDPRHYYTKYPEEPNKSLVAGPKSTRLCFERSVQRILTKGQNQNAAFSNLAEILTALRSNLASLKETEELIGLETANDIHIENVDAHTQSVVKRLIDSDYFKELDPNAQLLCEVAAYLHDIGKGPKSRWAAKGGKQQAERDHPLRSVEMLVRILTEEIREIAPTDVRSLAKLICYHDLVGDILGRERDIAQLEDISETEKDLDMLIALGMADMRAISNSWFENHTNEVPALRAQVTASLKARA
jgi:hypothetical protein